MGKGTGDRGQGTGDRGTGIGDTGYETGDREHGARGHEVRNRNRRKGHPAPCLLILYSASFQ